MKSNHKSEKLWVSRELPPGINHILGLPATKPENVMKSNTTIQ